MPVVETKTTITSVLITSPNPLLAEDLKQQLEPQHLSVTLHYWPSLIPDIAPDYIFCLYPSQMDTDHLAAVIALAQLHQSKLLIAEDYRQLELVNGFIPRLNQIDYRLCLLTDVYGPFEPDFKVNPLLELLCQTIHGHSLTLPQQDQAPTYPTYGADIAAGLVKAMFATNTRQQTFWLSTLEGSSLSDLAYQLRTQVSEVFNFTPTIEFSPTLRPSPNQPDLDAIATTQAQLNWQPQTDLNAGIKQTLDHLALTSPKAQPEKKLLPLPKFSLPPVRRFKMPYRFILASFLVFLILAPPGLFAINLYLGGRALSTAINQLEQNQPELATAQAQMGERYLDTSRQLLQVGHRLFYFLGENRFNRYDRFLDAGSRLAQTVADAGLAVNQALELYQIILGRSDSDFDTASSQLKLKVESLYTQLSLLQASLENTDFSSRLQAFNLLAQTKKKLPELRQRLELGLAIMDLLPAALNQPQPQTYLLLIQNNSELRPSGGFISAIGFVTLQSGRLINYQIDDVYQADNQLTGQVIPPQALKDYLGESNWYLRDSNWSPDFVSAARQAEWFIAKELNRSVAGTIGLNLFSLQSLLEATGPLQLDNQTVTSANLFELAQYGSQLDISAQPQKTEFLVPLTRELLARLHSGQVPLALLAKSLSAALTQQQLTLAFKDPQLQNIVSRQNWAGTLDHPACPAPLATDDCTSETFALIEANVGVNRSNYYLSRRLDATATINPQGQIRYQITVSYRNNSPAATWPGGRYKTYTRFYAPLNTQLLQARLGDQPIAVLSLHPLFELGLQEYAFVYEVPPGGEQRLTLELVSAQVLNLARPLSSLSVNWQKQTGAGSDPLTLILKYPEFLIPTQISQPAAVETGELGFSATLNSDTSFAVQFKR